VSIPPFSPAFRAALVASVATAGAVAAFAATAPHPVAAAVRTGDCTPDSSWPAANASLASQVMSLINQHRAGLGEGQLVTSPTLTASAVWKARHMANYNYFSHDDPAPPVTRTAADRVATCGYSASWGENIAEGFTSAQSVVDAWLNSAGHKANIENASFVATGIGVATAGNGVVYWVQDFGTVADGGSPPPTTSTTTTTPPPPPPPTTAPTTTSTTTTTASPSPPPPGTTTRKTTTSAPTTTSPGQGARGSSPVVPLRLARFALHVHARKIVLATRVFVGGTAPAAAQVKCAARLGSRDLRVVVNVYRHVQAHCVWRLPRGLKAVSAKRRVVVARGWVRVRQGSVHVRKPFRFRFVLLN
jgi:uncharacterized protein YkwD